MRRKERRRHGRAGCKSSALPFTTDCLPLLLSVPPFALQAKEEVEAGWHLTVESHTRNIKPVPSFSSSGISWWHWLCNGLAQGSGREMLIDLGKASDETQTTKSSFLHSKIISWQRDLPYYLIQMLSFTLVHSILLYEQVTSSKASFQRFIYSVSNVLITHYIPGTQTALKTWIGTKRDKAPAFTGITIFWVRAATNGTQLKA